MQHMLRLHGLERVSPNQHGYKDPNKSYGDNLVAVPVSVPNVGGNYSNGANCGSRYLNLNNQASNSNSNLGASPALAYEATL